MAKVSVIIPVYNVAPYLHKCLDSICNQTYKNLEILCIDDASTDNSLSILQAFEQKDKRITIYRHKINGKWASKARNTGLENATGKYIYFLDSDDWIDNDYIEKMVEKIEQTNANLVINSSICKEYNDSKCFLNFDFLNEDITYLPAEIVNQKLPPSVWSRIFRKSFIDRYGIRFPEGLLGQDMYFCAAVELLQDNIPVFKGPNYHYNNSFNSAMKQKERGFHYLQVYNHIYDYMNEHRLLNKMNIRLFGAEGTIIDSEEKFVFTKNYFNKIKNIINEAPYIYNDFDMFFFNIIQTTASYNDFKEEYNSNISLAYIKSKKIVCIKRGTNEQKS